MSKLAVLSGKEVCKILSRHGIEEVRRRGNHVVMQRRSPAGTISFRYPTTMNSKSGRRSPSFDKADF